MISVTDLAAEKISKAQEGQDMDGKMLRIEFTLVAAVEVINTL